MKLKTLVMVALAAASIGATVAASAAESSLADWVRSRCSFTPHMLDCLGSERRPSVESLVVTKGTVIWNATVVDTRDGSLSPHTVIVIDEGKIQKLAPIASIRIRMRGKAQAIDASGKYVVPGYLDMHAHALAAADQQPNYWPLFIANGITGFREMSGSPDLIKRAQQLNADIAAGRVDAPEVVITPSAGLLAGVATAAQAIQIVQQQKALGAGFIKIINVSRPAVFATLQEARNQGLHVAGHLVPSVSAVESSNAGWRSIEHLGAGYGALLDCAADEASIRQSILNGEGAPPTPPSPAGTLSPYVTRALDAPLYRRVINTYSEDKCQEVAKVFINNGTWHPVTLYRRLTMLRSDEQRFRSDPNLRYVDKTMAALWEQLAQAYETNVPPAARAAFSEYYGLELRLTTLLKQNRVNMLAGSDLGGIWVIAGFGLHDEFRELAKAGLSPLEILQATTLNGAKFLGREATMGTVDEGKNADLVLLNANPIRHAGNLDKIWAVFLKGKYFSKHALEEMKRDVADAYAGRTVNADLSTAMDLDHKH